MKKRLFLLCCVLCSFVSAIFAASPTQKVGIFYDPSIAQIVFAADDIAAELEAKEYSVERLPLSSLSKRYNNKKIVLVTEKDSKSLRLLRSEKAAKLNDMAAQAYALRTTEAYAKSYWVIGGDATGAMYGGFDIAEHIRFNDFVGLCNDDQSPAILRRGVKLNMPFDKRSPTYEFHTNGQSYKESIDDVWDLTFWSEWFDQMARNRYNVVSVWNNHPFTSLVKLEDYPDVALEDIEGYDGYFKKMSIEEKIEFWRSVMKMAHDRGFEFFFFNWNIWVSNANGMYGLADGEDTPANREYMYKSMVKLLETYPDLDGFGVTNGEKNSNEEFVGATYGKAMYDYALKNPKRKLRFIHRWHQTKLSITKSLFADMIKLPNVTFDMSYKYSMAHLYSTPVPKHFWGVDDLIENDLKTWFTVRNDDFYYNNWGDTAFAREYINGMMTYGDNFEGFYIGSDGFCPTRTFFCKDKVSQNILEVERLWYMNMIWGRLAYNPNTSDKLFKNYMHSKYPSISSDALFNAWADASRGIQQTNELIHATYDLDFRWYPEACLSYQGFITVDDFAKAKVGPGSSYCSIADSAKGEFDGKKSSFVLAEEIENSAICALATINTMGEQDDEDVVVTINNIKAMAYLSLYYANKIKGAGYKLQGKKSLTTDVLCKAYYWWTTYTTLMDKMYYGQSNQRVNAILPDWHFQDIIVLQEYLDNGGVERRDK